MSILSKLETATDPWIEMSSRWLAIAGGFVLAMIALLTVVSIGGRSLNFLGLGPIPGDFELVEAGCAVAVFSFLPWCQYNRGHVSVDILTNQFSNWWQNFFMVLGNIALSAVAIVMAARLWPGLTEKYAYGDTTFILAMPVWYAYALGMIGAILFAAVCIFTVIRSFNEMMEGMHIDVAPSDH